MKSILVLSLFIASLSQAALKVQTFTANEAGFLVNSHLITGEKDALLVDAQFTRSQAKKVSEMVKASGKNLVAILVTHAHPDHYLGLEVLKADFPKAKIIAAPEVIKGIQATADGKISYWKQVYKDDLADKAVIPEPYTEASYTLDGEKIELHKVSNAESEEALVLYIPSLKTVITGDLAYNGVHLWLAENRPDGWLTNLKTIKKLGKIDHVLPGHGAPGNSKILVDDESYIREFLKITAAAKTKEEAGEKLKKKFASYKLPVIADLSVGARVK
jgi:glyoxylase-like metal-dependent hydrolase (beta-lactamase superfamily II)